MIKYKKIIQVLLLGLLLSNLVMTFDAKTTYAQTGTKTYSGVQGQIETFLCAPSDAKTNPEATKGDLYNCINKVYRFTLILASVFAVFMIVIAGYVYMSAEGNEESVTKAKDILTTSVASLVILFSGYILLKFLNPDLIKFQSIQPPSVVGTSGFRQFSFEKLTQQDLQNITNAFGGANTITSQNEQQIRQLLSNNSINVNKQTPQTQLIGMTQSTINEIINLKKSCNCEITVTGGTEAGHSETGSCTHSKGNKFDIAKNSNIDAYITTNSGFTKLANRSDGAGQWRSNSGAVYANETTQGTGPHWDVAVCGGGTSEAPSQPTAAATGPPSAPVAPPPVTTGLLFLKPWGGADPYPDADYSNTKPEMRPAIQAFDSAWRQQGGSSLQVRQVYRSASYQDHLRSVWETYRIENGKNHAVGYGCDNYVHLDPVVIEIALKGLTPDQKTQLNKEYQAHGVTGPTPPACKSDHSDGVAVDITPPATSGATYQNWMKAGENVGLCHYIAGDTPHFALKKYLSANTNCQQS